MLRDINSKTSKSNNAYTINLLAKGKRKKKNKRFRNVDDFTSI
jgi:hypothetical protein